MKFALSLLAAALILSPLARAEAPREEVATLIKQLGDDNPKTRDEASQKLRKLKKEALGALAEAQKSDDPEIAARAQAVKTQIEEDLNPKPKATPSNMSTTI